MPSNPTIQRATIPDEAPPNNTFSVEVVVRQDTTSDPWGQGASACTSNNLDILAWRTPVRVKVDGETVDEQRLCIGSGAEKTANLSLSVPQGQHTVRVEAVKIEDNAYDFTGPDRSVNDDLARTVVATTDAPDPSREGAGETVERYIQQFADALGVGYKAALALGIVAVAILFLAP
jgi:hypothetical protein